MAIYTALPQSTNRSWNSLAIVKGKLYGSVETGGSAYIYEIDKVTGAETLKKTATGLNYRGIGNYKDTLAVVDIGGACLAYDTTDFTTVKYSWPAASGMVWTCVFGFLDNAYALKYNANSNQLGIFGSDGSVTFKTTSASTRYFSGVTLARNWIYGASQTGYIYKINTNTGEETQLTAAGTAAWRGLTSDTNYLYAAVAGGKIYRVNPTTGASEELTGDTVNRNWISLVWENGVIYGADNAGKIYSITLDTTVTAEYSYPSATGRQYMGLAEVEGELYTAINGAGIYSVNKSTGNITLVYSEVRDWRVMATVGSNLLCSQYGGSLKLISTSGTLVKNFGTDYWFGACDDPSDSNVAYSCCYSKASNQIAKLNISAGTVQYYTTANRTYVGIVCLGNYLYACVNGGLIYKIDKTTFAETVFCNESRAWIDMKTDGTYLYSVVNPGQVRRIDVSTGVSEIILGDPAGDNTNRPWQCLEYSSSDKAVWAAIYGWELWKLALPVPAAPTASVTSRFSTSLVTLSCSTSGATIKYTIDGSTPGLSNGTTYSSAITISQTTTLKFCAIKDGYVTAGSDVSVTVGSGLIGTYSILNATTRSYSAVGLWTQFYPDSNSTSGHKIYASYSAGGGNDTIAYLNSDGTTSQSATIPSVRGLSLYNMNLQSEVGQPVVISATYGGVVRGVSELDSGGSGWASSSTNNWSAVCVDDQILYPSGTVNTPVGYACCYGVGTLGVYDRATTTWTYKTITSRNYTGITSIGDYLYLSVDNGYVYKINKATLATTTLCSDSRAWTGLTNDGTYLYASVNNGNIYRINISTGVSEIILGDTSGDTTTRKWKGVVYSRRYNCLYAVVNGGALWEIDLYGAKAPYAIGAIDSKERKYNIQIFSETSGVSIKYTIDGSVPSATNGITYTGVFSVVSNCTVKYCAIKDGQVVYGSDVVISFNTLYVYDESNASWKLVTIPYVSNAGAWKQTNAIYEMVSGVWTRIY